MDYRALLVKYMAHIAVHEGVDYTTHCGHDSFTPEELAALRDCSPLDQWSFPKEYGYVPPEHPTPVVTINLQGYEY